MKNVYIYISLFNPIEFWRQKNMALKTRVFGKKIIVNLHAKHGYRVSPRQTPAMQKVTSAVRKECGGKKFGSRQAAQKCLSDAASKA